MAGPPFHPLRLLPVLLAAGCAATTPSAPPPVEMLVVLNAGDATLSWLILSASEPPGSIVLGAIGGTPARLAARGAQVLITTGAGGTLARIDLLAGQSPLVHRFPDGVSAGGVAFVNDSIAYVANPSIDQVTRINLRSGDTASVAVGRSPDAVAVSRGRVFVANRNLEPVCEEAPPCVAGPSWLSVIDPEQSQLVDSIPLFGPGNATAIEVGGDGLLYVLHAGTGDSDGWLSIVDPVLRTEVGGVGGLGALPADLATDRRERLFIISAAEGLMEFNTRTRRLIRGAGGGIPLLGGRAAVVDDAGLIYAVESGGCAGPAEGRVRVFRPNLTETRIVATGPCAVDAVIVKPPPPPSAE